MTIFTNSASVSELRAYCSKFDIHVDGDKRRKASYLEAIEAYQAECGDKEPDCQEEDLTQEECDQICDDIMDEGEYAEDYPGVAAVEADEAIAVGFAPIALFLGQIILGVVAALVYLGVYGIILLVKGVKRVASLRVNLPEQPSFYQQTKDLMAA